MILMIYLVLLVVQKFVMRILMMQSSQLNSVLRIFLINFTCFQLFSEMKNSIFFQNLKTQLYGAQRSLISLKLLSLLLGFSSFSLRKSIYFILTVIGYSMHRHVKKFTSIHTLPSPYHLHFTLSAHKSASSKHLKLKANKKKHTRRHDELC